MKVTKEDVRVCTAPFECDSVEEIRKAQAEISRIENVDLDSIFIKYFTSALYYCPADEWERYVVDEIKHTIRELTFCVIRLEQYERGQGRIIDFQKHFENLGRDVQEWQEKSSRIKALHGVIAFHKNKLGIR